MESFKQYTTPSDLMMLTPEKQDELWKWANRAKANRPPGMGLTGMPLLSIGRCIEFLIDHGVPLKELMGALAIDFHDNSDRELLDILWESVKVVINKPKLQRNEPTYKWISAPDLVTKGTMVQWIDRLRWKQLTDPEKSRLQQWASNSDDDMRLFFNLNDMPMLSIGRLIEFLIDKGMSLKEIFEQCAKYENAEWNKLQLIDVLWDKVKIILKIPLTKIVE